MKKQFSPVIVAVVILLAACAQPVAELPEETATRTALPTSTSTPTPTATLPPTFTPVPALTQVQITPTTLYSPIELSAADNEVYQKALSDIPLYRQGDIQIVLQDEDGNPLSGYLVKYNQVSHDFLFAGITDNFYIGELKQAGINTMTVYLAWD